MQDTSTPPHPSFTDPTARARASSRWALPAVAVALLPGLGSALGQDPLSMPWGLTWPLVLAPVLLGGFRRGPVGALVGATVGTAGLLALLLTGAPLAVVGVLLGLLVGAAAGIGWLTALLHRERLVVERLAFTDNLTGLANRRHLSAFLDPAFASAQRGSRLVLVLFDLDHFKAFNDEHGHAAGDAALVAFSEVLRENTRRMNLSARYGGEEFLSVLLGVPVDGALVFVDRVRDGLRARRLGTTPLTVSVGVAAYHPAMKGVEELISAADHALYRAKSEGRDRVRVFGRSTPGAEPPSGTEAPEGPRERTLRAGPSSAEIAAAVSASAVQPIRRRVPAVLGEDRIGEGRSVLFAGGEAAAAEGLADCLRDLGFTLRQPRDEHDAARLLERESDLLVVDAELPWGRSADFVRTTRSRWPGTQTLVVCGAMHPAQAADLLKSGADFFLVRPLLEDDVRARTTEAVVRRSQIESRSETKRGDPGGSPLAREATDTILKSARSLVNAVELLEPHARGHGERVARYSAALAREWNHRGGDPIDVEALVEGAQLHDLGKIVVPDTILNKRIPLTSQEVQVLQRHPVTGFEILRLLLENPVAVQVARWHHEHWDGGGYPDRLAGPAIPLCARIVGLADALEAMTSLRPYRPPLEWDEAIEQIERLAGRQFDPGLLPVLLAVRAELRDIHREELARETALI